MFESQYFREDVSSILLGESERNLIPYGKQDIDVDDIAAVTSALSQEFLTQGPTVGVFERALAAYTNASFAVAVNSATSALHLSCLALGVGEGDLVWTSAVSFVASANAARYCGADVDFVDIDATTANVSVEALEKKLRLSRDQGDQLPKVFIPVHMAGQPCDMEEISRLSEEYGFKIIEDASHALGSSYLDQRIGYCEFSDITVFSFHPVKMITTGEGGACLTNDEALAAKIQRLRSHGITRSSQEMQFANEGGWYYEQLDLGFNYRLTDIQSALGISQLRRLDFFVAERNAIAKRYVDLLSESQLQPLRLEGSRASSFHLFIVRTDDPTGAERKRLFELMRSHGILVNVHYIPIYRHPYYRSYSEFQIGDFNGSELYYKTCLSLPIYPGLSSSDQDKVVRILGQRLGHQTIF